MMQPHECNVDLGMLHFLSIRPSYILSVSVSGSSEFAAVSIQHLLSHYCVDLRLLQSAYPIFLAGHEEG